MSRRGSGVAWSVRMGMRCGGAGELVSGLSARILSMCDSLRACGCNHQATTGRLQTAQALVVKERVRAGRVAGGAGGHWTAQVASKRLEEVLGRMRGAGGWTAATPGQLR